MNKWLFLFTGSIICSLYPMEREWEEQSLKKRKNTCQSEQTNKKIKQIDIFEETIGAVLAKEPLLNEKNKKISKQRLQGFDCFCWLETIRADHISLENFNEYNEKSAQLFEHWITDPELIFSDDKQKIGILTHHIQSACRDGQPELIPILVQHGAQKNSYLFDLLMQGYNSKLRHLLNVKQSIQMPPPRHSFLMPEDRTMTVVRNMKNNPDIDIRKFLLPIYIKAMRNLVVAGIDVNQNKEFADVEAYDNPKEMILNPRHTEWTLPLCMAVDSLIPEFVTVLLFAGAHYHLKSADGKTAYEILQEKKGKTNESDALSKIEKLFEYHAINLELWNKQNNFFFKLLPIELQELFFNFLFGYKL